MICAGTGSDPMRCGEEAVTIISGFAQCQKHANEIAMQFKMLKKQLEKKRIVPAPDPDLKYAKSLTIEDLQQKQGVWKNVKNTDY